MKKRILAFLLAVSIAVSMLVLPASAAGNANTAVDNEDKQVAVRPWIRLAFRFLERHL